MLNEVFEIGKIYIVEELSVWWMSPRPIIIPLEYRKHGNVKKAKRDDHVIDIEDEDLQGPYHRKKRVSHRFSVRYLQLQK